MINIRNGARIYADTVIVELMIMIAFSRLLKESSNKIKNSMILFLGIFYEFVVAQGRLECMAILFVLLCSFLIYKGHSGKKMIMGSLIVIFVIWFFNSDMYKPIAEDNNTTICALMKLYRTYYRVIGLVIAIIGCALTPFIPKLISGDVPKELNIYILYLLNLGATVLSYWLYAYKNSILQAHQRTDIVSKVTLVTSTVQYVLQLLVLWLFKDYYLYVIVLLATQAFSNDI